jgi:uncharacterized membrane protein YeaQ/YmgE (transglycosylase-associated protein family)
MYISPIFVFAVIGGLAGLAARQALPSNRYSAEMSTAYDIAMGMAGAISTGFGFDAVMTEPVADITLMVAAFIGAVVLVGLWRLFTPGR